MVALDNSVRMVMLQFSFSNSKIVPRWVWEKSFEKWGEWKERKNNEGTGETAIPPTKNCSLIKFLDELEIAGYKMVDALYQPRTDPKDNSRKRKYHMVRFIFVRREYLEELPEGFKNAQKNIHDELRKMCKEAMWRIRVFLNPFFQDNEEVPGHHALSINLELRTPLVQSDGQPVVVWQKDNQDNRIGDAPLPLKPDHYLHITENAIQLI